MYIVQVDGDPEAQQVVRRAIARSGQHIDLITVDSLRSALCVLSSMRVGCVVTDLVLRDVSGTEIVRRLRAAQPGIPIVVFASESARSFGNGLLPGEWLPKEGSDVDGVAVAIRDALGRGLLADAAKSDAVADGPDVTRFGGSDFIASTACMRRALALVESAAESDVPVLLEGETGTGKEILARALHARSSRRQAAFVVQNCGAMAEHLLETELFGHVRGAFTGAERDRPGLFLEAGAGTVFLDEVGEASASVQSRLLRVLQHREVKQVGSDRAQRVSARIVAATNRPLIEEVRAGRFRADLYYRLGVFPIHVPPLRQRTADIPRLVRHFLYAFSTAEKRDGMMFSEEALHVLAGYHWPGNVRELEHEIHRLVLTSSSNTLIAAEHLAPRIRNHEVSANEPLDEMLARVEVALIRDRLGRFPTKADAARSLGITREGLYAKLRRLGMAGPPAA